MIDRPDADRLLVAVADALSDEVLPALSTANPQPETVAAARYIAVIAANLCRILAREVTMRPGAEAATVADLRALLGRDGGSLAELVSVLDETLRDGATGAAPEVIHRVLAADVERRLAISRPSYADAVGGPVP